MRRTGTRYRRKRVSLLAAYMDCITVLERPNPGPIGGPHHRPARLRAKPDRHGVMRWRLVRYLSHSLWNSTRVQWTAMSLAKRLNTRYLHNIYVGEPVELKAAEAEAHAWYTRTGPTQA